MEYKTFKMLLEKYHSGTLNDSEKELFFKILYSPEHRSDLQQFIDEGLADPLLEELGDKETLELIYQQIQLNKTVTEEVTETPSLPFLRRIKWPYVAAAASIIVLMGVALHFLQPHSVELKPTMVFHDIAPGGNKAILKLADGSVITLDNSRNGKLADQGNVAVIKNNDQLVYDASVSGKNASGKAVSYNTLSTPRGGKYRIILPDGTTAWLNAVSSITFPTSFIGKERRVEIMGEVYFEVSKYTSKNNGQRLPFIVSVKNKTEIKVLGTHFNINAYDDEATIKTTLLEGSVHVSSFVSHRSIIIKPGQQASFDPEGKMTVKEADPEEAVAWKEGLFMFENTTIEDVMRQVARWYDVKVVYESHPDIRLTGIVSRNVNLSGIIQLLEANGTRVKVNDNVVSIR